jgi:type IV pilus assembly protein PilE
MMPMYRTLNVTTQTCLRPLSVCALRRCRRIVTRRQDRGFTLLEIMMTLVILLILARLAMPVWHEQIRRMYRAQARVAMLDSVLSLERHHLAANTYGHSDTPDQVAGTWPRPVLHGKQVVYHIEASPCASSPLTQCAELRAVPVTDDAQCGSLVMRTTGETFSTPMHGGADTDATARRTCW